MGMEELTSVVEATQSGKKLIDILPKPFVECHKAVLMIVRKMKSGDEVTDEEMVKLTEVLDVECERVVEHFTLSEKEKDQGIDRSKPRVLLKS